MNNSLFSLVEDLVQANKSYKKINISGIKTDSKQVTSGDLFIAVPGENFDGHDFIDQAIDNGASAVITNGREMNIDPIPQIKVANPRKAVSHVSSKLFGNFTACVSTNFSFLSGNAKSKEIFIHSYPKGQSGD